MRNFGRCLGSFTACCTSEAQYYDVSGSLFRLNVRLANAAIFVILFANDSAEIPTAGHSREEHLDIRALAPSCSMLMYFSIAGAINLSHLQRNIGFQPAIRRVSTPAPAVSPVMVMTAWNRAAIELSGMELHEGVKKYRG